MDQTRCTGNESYQTNQKYQINQTSQTQYSITAAKDLRRLCNADMTALCLLCPTLCCALLDSAFNTRSGSTGGVAASSAKKRAKICRKMSSQKSLERSAKVPAMRTDQSKVSTAKGRVPMKAVVWWRAGRMEVDCSWLIIWSLMASDCGFVVGGATSVDCSNVCHFFNSSCNLPITKSNV